MHLCEGCMHLMVYQWRPRQKAEVRSSQSRLHSVQRTKRVWRSKNSYIVIDVRGLGDKDSPTFSKMFRNGTSFQQIHVSVGEELGAQSPRTLISAIRNSVRAKCRIFLQSNEFITFGTIKGPTYIVRNFLNIPQDVFVLVMLWALNAGLNNGPPTLTMSSSWFIFVFQGMTVFISDSIETKHGFFGTPGTRMSVPRCLFL